MILTVTPNTAIDRVIFFQEFDWGRTIRAQEALWSPGGKGTDVAWILGELGQTCLATGLAAAENGQRLQRMLKAQGARVDFVWVDGETRINYVLIDTALGRQSTITVNSLIVRPEHIAELEARIERQLPECRVLLLGGSVPAGVAYDWYVPWIRRARAQGAWVMLDASGPTLAQCVPAGPSAIKPNLDELAELTGRPINGREEALAAARELLSRGIELVLASLGAQGALAVTRDQAYYLPPLAVRPVNCAGAGDGMTAGLISALAEGLSLEEGLRRAVATATAVVVTPGTAECHRADIESFLPQVRLERVG